MVKEDYYPSSPQYRPNSLFEEDTLAPALTTDLVPVPKVAPDEELKGEQIMKEDIKDERDVDLETDSKLDDEVDFWIWKYYMHYPVADPWGPWPPMCPDIGPWLNILHLSHTRTCTWQDLCPPSQSWICYCYPII